MQSFSGQEMKQDVKMAECRFPCEDLDLNIVSTTHDPDEHDGGAGKVAR